MSSIPRFFVPPEAIQNDHIVLPADAAHHALNVLRLRPGELLIVHDGTGKAYRCRLSEGATKSVATAQIEEMARAATEPQTRLAVAQALPKTGEKIEEVLQHGTEVGAAGFVIWNAARSVAKLESGGDKLEKRLQRWRGIVKGAAEQSGRGVLPTVAWLGSGSDLTRALADYDAVLVLHESAATGLRDALCDRVATDAYRLLLIIGPEGGLTDTEVTRFTEGGAIPVSLGPRVLRTETAALVALAQVLYHRGE